MNINKFKSNIIPTTIRELKNKVPLFIIFAVHIILLLFAIGIYNNSIKKIDELNDHIIQHHIDEARYDSIVKTLDAKILLCEDSIKNLKLLKSKIDTVYDTKIKYFSDVTLISNDEITRYISTKIHNRER